MKIGIVIAIAREMKSFLDANFSFQVINYKNKEIFQTDINNNEFFIIQSGYGKIDAACGTQILISKFDCEIILNFGVTGALDCSLKVSDLFIVKSCVNYDYDVSPIDPVKKNQYEEFSDIYIPLDNRLIDLAKSIKPDLKEAIVASGDAFIDKKEDKLRLANLGCNICDMEIAGIARTCFKNDVPCLSIKCISDTFNGDGGDFNKNVQASSNVAFNLIKELLYKF